MTTWQILCGDVRERLRELPDQSVQCVVTSPPYWGLRDYGHAGQIGLEATHHQYIGAVASLFSEDYVWRVLKDDGVVWLNLGDSYAAGGHGGGGCFMQMRGEAGSEAWAHRQNKKGWRKAPEGLKPKDLVGIPWHVAFAIQSRGWYLRSDVIWNKPNPMPESVRDRPTKAHEYVFLFSKSEQYYYNADAIKNPPAASTLKEIEQNYSGTARKDFSGTGAQNASEVKARIVKRLRDKQRGHSRRHAGFNDRWDNMSVAEQRALGSNARTVWTIPTQPYPEAHFATFPEELPEKCILAGSREGDTVLDPFCGSGTTGAVSVRHQRSFIGIELNPSYVELARKRIGNVAPLLAREVA